LLCHRSSSPEAILHVGKLRHGIPGSLRRVLASQIQHQQRCQLHPDSRGSHGCARAGCRGGTQGNPSLMKPNLTAQAKHWQRFPARALCRIRCVGIKRNFLLNYILRLPWLLQAIMRGALGRCCLHPSSRAGLGWAEPSWVLLLQCMLS